MGGDSAGVSNYSLSVRGDKKVFKNNDYIFGFTSSFRMGQILRYRFEPKPCPDWDLEKYMCTDFIDGIRKCLTEYGHDEGGEFLVGYQGRVFHIHSDYQVGWNIVPYDACGCGSHIALGVMDAIIDRQDLTPEQKIERALKSAEQWSAGVRGPFHIEVL